MATADSAYYHALIAAAFPDLRNGTARVVGAGWDCVAVDLDGRLVFRFPRHAAAEQSLLTEIRLLPELAPLLPVPIPRYTHVSEPMLDYPYHFAGYARLPGTPMDEAGPTVVSDECLATSIGRFIAALHGVPPDQAEALGVPTYSPEGWLERHRSLYEQARRLIVAHLSREAVRALDAFWHDALDDPAMCRFTPRLIHGDLVPEHILLAPDRSRVSGIIDWGDAMVADPALDYAGFPEPFARAMLAAVGNSSQEAEFRQRWNVYHSAAPLHAIVAGEALGRPELIADGLRALRGGRRERGMTF